MAPDPAKQMRQKLTLSIIRLRQACRMLVKASGVAVMTAALSGGASMAREEMPAEACDRLAALEADPFHTAPPVAFAAIDPATVIPACREALATEGAQRPRLWLQLGRGYLRAGQIDAAMDAFSHAHKARYPAAGFALGMMYFLGDDIAADHDRALMLFTAAYDQGVIWAALGMAELHADPMSPHHDMDRAAAWHKRWQQQMKQNKAPTHNID